MSRHLELTDAGRPAVAQRDTTSAWALAWGACAVLWAYITWRAAQNGWPPIVVATTLVAAWAAWSCGYLTARRSDRNEDPS